MWLIHREPRRGSPDGRARACRLSRHGGARQLRSAVMHLSRRRLLALASQSFALGGAGLLAACQTAPQAQAPTSAPNPTVAPTAKPAIAPAASVAPATVSPAAIAKPSPSAAASVGPSPSPPVAVAPPPPARAAGAVGG